MKTNPPQLETDTMTIEEFELLPDDGWRLELVRGHVVREPPAGYEHGGIAGWIAGELHSFIREHGLGRVIIADAGFVLSVEPPTVRAPDVAFVREEGRVFDRERFAPFAPDLSVEVVTAVNTMPGMLEKIQDYLDAGTRLVWVIDPGPRCVTVYRSRDNIRMIGENGELDGADVLPGFRLKVSELFES